MARLRKGTKLFRFHKNIFPPDSFNPNSGRRMDLPEDGARFNPFPGAPAPNVPTLYAASSLAAAALETFFMMWNIFLPQNTPAPACVIGATRNWK
jgi:hypothetical protein